MILSFAFFSINSVALMNSTPSSLRMLATAEVCPEQAPGLVFLNPVFKLISKVSVSYIRIFIFFFIPPLSSSLLLYIFMTLRLLS